MKRWISALISATLLLGLCACGEKAPTWLEQYDLGMRYLSDGNYEDAIIAFTAAIEIDPKQAPAYVGRGDAYAGVAETVPVGDSDEKLIQDRIACYQSVIEDYLAALELDESTSDIYKKTAQIYVLLGDTESAIEILERGISHTGDEGLRDYLDELTAVGPLTVLTYQAAYRPDGTLVSYDNYYYNEQGYITRIETTFHDEDSIHLRVESWEYDDTGNCWYIPDRQGYSTEEEWAAAKFEDRNEPGTNRFSVNSDGEDYAICLDPLVYEDRITAVQNNNSILENTDSGMKWDYAVYTFNDTGCPVAITTYADGAVSGTAVLEWETITPKVAP